MIVRTCGVCHQILAPDNATLLGPLQPDCDKCIDKDPFKKELIALAKRRERIKLVPTTQQE